jgi:hypothetical protein
VHVYMIIRSRNGGRRSNRAGAGHQLCLQELEQLVSGFAVTEGDVRTCD